LIFEQKSKFYKKIETKKTNFKFEQNMYKNLKSGKTAKTIETRPDRRTKK
jgi:ribosomal protein S17